jgi:sec-independent protein translocase protein TatA
VIGGLTSPWHLLVVAVVALLVFGPEKLPEIARQVGKVHQDFRRFQASLNDEVRGVLGQEPLRPSPPPPPAPPPNGARSPSSADRYRPASEPLPQKEQP